MIILTSFGLIVSLGVLYLAWRFVDNQPSEKGIFDKVKDYLTQ